jgi:GNAT superfamily N-acetyltransferase
VAIREARLPDIEAMVRLSESFRESLTDYSPVFWRKAEESFARQAAYFRVLLPLDDTVAMLAEQAGEVRGFVIGRLQPPPPVYAPGGPVCLIDDFCLISDAEWPTTGFELLSAVEAWAKARGAVLSVVICPHLGVAKRDFLRSRGFQVTSEWHIRDL